MTVRVVLSADPAHVRRPGPEERDAVDAALKRLGVELVPAGEASQLPAGDASLGARLTQTPRPWRLWDEAVEVPDTASLVRLLETAAACGVLEQCAADPVACAVQARRRLGPPPEAGSLWLFGAGLVGRQTAALLARAGVPAAGFLDNDPGLSGAEVCGLPVRAPAGAPAGAAIVVCTGGGHDGIAAQLAGLGFPRPLGLSEAVLLLGLPSEPERGYLDDLLASRHRYVGLAALLADERSRRTLAAVLHHRLTWSPAPLREARCGDQWFIPEVFSPDAGAVFVDGGAYDGDSAAEFVRRNGGPGQALELVEPDEDLARRAAEAFAGMPQVHVHRAALGAAAGAALFSCSGGMDGALAGDAAGRGPSAGSSRERAGDDEGPGVHRVEVVSVDDLAPDGATYLKLDVEGAEEQALEGARSTIRRSHPVLAVAAYHRAADLWRVPAWIASLGTGYSVYLRHHTELPYETVAYGLPLKGS